MAILLTQEEHGDFRIEQKFSDPHQTQYLETQRTPRPIRIAPLPWVDWHMDTLAPAEAARHTT